jgi:hypothetical protein
MLLPCFELLQAQVLSSFRDQSTGKWGYKNESGQVVILPAYSEARNFENGVAQVAMVKKEREWGLINEAGEYVLKPTYNGMERFCNGYAAVSYGDPGFDNNIRWGFIDLQGKEVVKPRFYLVEECISDDKWFKVQYKGGTWKYVNLQDKESKEPTITEYIGLPTKDFHLSLSISENAVMVTDRVTKKEAKVELPGEGKMTGNTFRLNDYVTAIPCIGTANASGITHYYLLIPDKTGGTFLKPSNGSAPFYTTLQYKEQIKSAFVAGSDLYNHQGELTGTNAIVDFKPAYYYLSYKSVTGNEQLTGYYNIAGTPLNLPTVKDLMVFEAGDYLTFIHDGKVQLLNFKTNQVTQTFYTYDEKSFQQLVKEYCYRTLYDALKKSNALPIRMEDGVWSYVGLSGGAYNTRVKADYILPFFDNKYAIAYTNGKCGVINKKGDMIAGCEYDSVFLRNMHLFKNGQEYYITPSDIVEPYKPAPSKASTSTAAGNQNVNDPEKVGTFCVEGIYYTPSGTPDVDRIVMIAIVTTRQKNVNNPDLKNTVTDRMRTEVQTNFGTYFFSPGKNQWVEPVINVYADTDKCMKMRESITNGYEKGKTIFITY